MRMNVALKNLLLGTDTASCLKFSILITVEPGTTNTYVVVVPVRLYGA